ncbi:transposase [Caenibacillus caldisaponilyticus]
MLNFYKYPKDVRKFIYTNMIERANKEIRKKLI